MPAELVGGLLKDIDADRSTRLQIEEFGKRLFDSVFAGTVGQKYYASAAVAKDQGRRLRVCLSVLAPNLLDVPWEYLRDQSGFLLEHGHSIVRVLDELSGGKSSFAPVQRLLCIAASPKDRSDFGAGKHLAELAKALEPIGGLQVDTLYPATVNEIYERITGGTYDMVYYVGHGEASADGGQLLCQNEQGNSQWLKAHKLAAWLRDARTVRFVFLNSCSTAAVRDLNPFAGIAQKLMLDGDVAAVAAMQVDVPIDAALAMAAAFFKELKRKSPEAAILACRAHATDDFSFGIPVLYSYLDAPAQWEVNRLRTFLSADEDSRYALLLPCFFQGRMEKPPPSPNPNREYVYPGETLARSDVDAAWYVVELLQRTAPLAQIRLLSHADIAQTDQSHLFLFGSQSNPVVAGVLKETARFQFDYRDKDGYWSLRDTKTGTEISVQAPYLLGMGEFAKVDDYGVIEKIVHKETQRVYFVLAGFGDRATMECAYYLARNWESLLDKHGSGPFQMVLKVPGSMPAHSARPIEPEKG